MSNVPDTIRAVLQRDASLDDRTLEALEIWIGYAEMMMRQPLMMDPRIVEMCRRNLKQREARDA